MAQQTLLEMTQNILSRLDSDEVNSISDTTESMQVARIIRNKYYDIVSRADLPEQQALIQLTASGSALKPTQMTIPDGVSDIRWIKYFDSDPGDGGSDTPGYKYVNVIGIDQFMDLVNRLNPNDDNIDSFTFTEGANGYTLYYATDAQPRYCTVIENNYVLFDAYNSDFDTTLQASKTMVMATVVTPFTLSDSFVPDLEDNQFPLLLNEATSLAFFELKQTPHLKAEQEIKRQWSQVQKNKTISNKPSYFDQLPDFGRVPRTGGYSTSGVYRWMRGGIN